MRRLVDGGDILTAAGIIGVAVWIHDAAGWPAAVGAIGVCLLGLGIGSVLVTLMRR